MEKRYTKTFTEVSHFRRRLGDVQWQKMEPVPVPLDQQIKEWVDQTGSLIQHPGQIGIHVLQNEPDTERQQQILTVTYGLAVLYVEGTTDASVPTAPAATAGVRSRPEDGSGPTRTTIPVRASVPIPNELARAIVGSALADSQPAGDGTHHVAVPAGPQWTGTTCPCGQPQFLTPSGRSCANGHGYGVDGEDQPEPTPNPPPRRRRPGPFLDA